MEYKDKVTEHYKNVLQDSYDCVDRLVINGYCPLLVRACGFRYWYRTLKGEDKTLDNAQMKRFSGRFSRRLQAFCKKETIPFIYFKSGERKHESAEALIPKQKNYTGLFAVFVSRASASIWDIKRFSNNIDIRRKENLSFVNHYYFQIIDKNWGHVTIKMCSYPPFSTQIILNGHEWAQRHPKAKGLELEKQGNCFTNYTDGQLLTRYAGTLKNKGQLAKVCNRWIYKCLWFAVDYKEQQRTGLKFEYSIYQVEYSRNLLFQRGRFLDQVYQGIIDSTRPKLDVPKITTMFGQKKRPYVHDKTRACRSSALEVRIERPDYNLTIFKIHFGKLTVKLYDKGERTLRAEVVVHNAKALKCKRSISNFQQIVTKLEQIMNGFMNNLSYLNVALIDQLDLSKLAAPSQKGTNRLAGINLTSPRIVAVLQAILALSLQPGGYTSKQLSQKMQSIGHTNYTARMAAYDLKKVRAKGFVDKISARKYQNTSIGIQNIIALIAIVQQKVPLSLAILKNDYSIDAKELLQVEQHHLNIKKEIVALNAFYNIHYAAA